MQVVDLFSNLTAAEIKALKIRFAEATLRIPENSFLAAQSVFGTEIGRALFAHTHWVSDPEVMAEKANLLNQNGARHFLPTKEETAREIWKVAVNERTPIEDKARMFSLFSDVMGYKEQAVKNSGGITVNNNKVMIVKDFGSDSDWERESAAQQHRLTNNKAQDVVPRVLQ